MRQVSRLDTTTVVSSNGIFTICTSCGLGSKKVNITPLLDIKVEFASETWCEVVNDAFSDGRVLYRSANQVVLAETSHMCHLM